MTPQLSDGLAHLSNNPAASLTQHLTTLSVSMKSPTPAAVSIPTAMAQPIYVLAMTAMQPLPSVGVDNLSIRAGGDSSDDTTNGGFNPVVLAGGKFYAPFAISNLADSTIEDFLTNNPDNDAAMR